MMTSNFATDIHHKFPNAWNIARKPNPSQMRTGMPRYLELAPKEELLDEYNNGLVTWAEYTERYQRENLDKLKPFKVYSDLGQDAMLLCVCARSKLPQCHRRLIAGWFEEHLGIEVPEFELDQVSI